MIGIVGLGNPGARYAGTRHNAGVDFARALARERGILLRADKKLFAECGRSPDGDFWLATPDLFMNESGAAVAAVAQWRNLRPERILVAHDEIDLPPGVARFKFGGGEAGHNGLRDITQKIGTRDYWRLRIGVGRPEQGLRRRRRLCFAPSAACGGRKNRRRHRSRPRGDSAFFA